jgi:hypothetical protein
VVNSSQGGGSKDTWVLAREPMLPRPRPSDVESYPVADRDVSTRDTAPGQGMASQQ